MYNLRTGVVDTSIRICEHTLCRVCTCARVRTVYFHYRWGTRVGVLGYSMRGTGLLAWRVIFDMIKIGVLSVFSLFFDGVWRVCRCMCVDTRAHTHIARRGYSECEPRSRDGTLGEPEKSRWTKTQDKYIFVDVSKYTCIYKCWVAG